MPLSGAWNRRCLRILRFSPYRPGRRVSAAFAALLLLPVADITMAETIEGRVVGITDGDTFTLLTPDSRLVKVRVAESDAPEPGQPYATRSRQHLA
jgi:endonuclease YncB( thermonuclease family)